MENTKNVLENAEDQTKMATVKNLNGISKQFLSKFKIQSFKLQIQIPWDKTYAP